MASATTTNQALKGYSGLANLMSHGVPPVFKRFAELNAHNLMTMQAELLQLDSELKTIEFGRRVCQSPENVIGEAEKVEALAEMDRLEAEILQKIKVGLRDYSEWVKDSS